MCFTANDLIGVGLEARDGAIGSVRDLYFDSHTWDVRYLVVDTGKWLPGRDVLLIPKVIGEFRPGLPAIPVDLAIEQIRQSPPVAAAEPVSRLAEKLIHSHYNWTPHWAETVDPVAPPPVRFVSREQRKEAEQYAGQTTLQSFAEVRGYHLHATDGEVGHLDDVAIGGSWNITGLVIDTSNWPGGRCVVVPREWIDHITWADAQIVVNVTREQVQGAESCVRAGVSK